MIGSDIVNRSTRFLIFDHRARIITEYQTEFTQIMPHPGLLEHDPEELVSCMKECIIKAVSKLEQLGWAKESIKGIGSQNHRIR